MGITKLIQSRRGTRTSSIRRASGLSIMELVVSSALLGFVLVVIGELVSLNALASVKLSNKSDTLNASRFAAEKICADVRSAIGFGDMYAAPENRNMFPDLSRNPFFTGTPDSSCWRYKWPPVKPVSWDPCKLDGQCLILQQPTVFLDQRNDPKSSAYDPLASQNTLNGLPTFMDVLKPGIEPPSDLSVRVQNLDTVIYKVFADPQRPGEYLLKKVKLPGANVPNSACTDYSRHTIIEDPQTVLTGIVGPIDPVTNKLRLFRYLYQSSDSNRKSQYVSTDEVSSQQVPLLFGVAIDIEVRKPDSAVSSGTSDLKYTSRLAFHLEATKRVRKNIAISYPPR